MMSLTIQIQTFLFSLLFGMFFSFVIDILHNYLFSLKNPLQFILTFLIILIMSYIYFKCLLYLNNVIIHPYYIIAFILGFFNYNVGKRIFKKIVKSNKRWYNEVGVRVWKRKKEG